MLRKFVLITGALDIPIGLATIAAALFQPRDEHFGALMTVGAFLMFAGAALVWAAQDMTSRAPIVFWQGFVRLTAVGSILYMVPAGLAEFLAIRRRRVRWNHCAGLHLRHHAAHRGAGFFGLMMGKSTA